MDSHDRQIVGLRYVAGLSSDDIGRELGMPGSAVQARVARILKQLLEAVRNLEVAGDRSRPTSARSRSGSGHSPAARSCRSIPKRSRRTAIAQAAAEVSPADRLARAGWACSGSASARPTRASWPWRAGRSWSCSRWCSWAAGGGGRRRRPSIATPFPTDATRLCEPNELQLRVTAVGAGGQRSDGDGRDDEHRWRRVPGRQPARAVARRGAADADAHRHATCPGRCIRIGPGDMLRTSVRVRNYCGPAPKRARDARVPPRDHRAWSPSR